MPGEIERAIEKFEERKDAVVGEARGAGASTTGDDGARLMLSGFDLDLSELDEMRQAAAATGLAGINNSVDRGRDGAEVLLHMLMSLWVDGLLTGIVLQKDREKGTP